MQPYFHRGSTALSAHFQHIFVPLPYFIRGRFANFSTRRNKSPHTQGHLSFAGKNGPLYCYVYSSISLSLCLKLTVWTTLTFLLGLLSAVLIAVAFRHLATKPLFYFACFYFYFSVFSRRGYCRLAAIVLHNCLGCCAVLHFSLPFLILAAIFLPCHFIAVEPAISQLFIQGWTLSCCYLLWSCRRHIHFAAKGVFVVTTSRRLVFFLLFWFILLVIFTPSCCSYCHCSTGSNSHTVVLSKPASYSLVLFSVPVIIHEQAYRCVAVRRKYGSCVVTVR